MIWREVPAKTLRPPHIAGDGCESCGGPVLTTIKLQFGVGTADQETYRVCSACADRAYDNVHGVLRRIAKRAMASA